MTGAVRPTATGVLVRIRVQPRASRSEVVGLHGDAIRIRLAAPPIDGAANQALLELLAGLVDVTPSRLELKSGQASRNKTVLISGLTAADVWARLGLTDR